uniref:Uncharacterized protein n=1 Tax=Cacopsylla melanoneura TaxID=428564 RepID=A0A8D9ELG7_9HEMI
MSTQHTDHALTEAESVHKETPNTEGETTYYFQDETKPGSSQPYPHSESYSNQVRRGFIIGLLANFSTMAAGNAMAWSSPSIPNMMDQGLIDEYEAAWLTSMLAVGASIGPFLAYRSCAQYCTPSPR